MVLRSISYPSTRRGRRAVPGKASQFCLVPSLCLPWFENLMTKLVLQKKDSSPMVNLLLVAPSLATFSFGLRLHGIMSHCMALMMPPEVQRSCEDASMFSSDIACSCKMYYTATHIGFLEIFNKGPMRRRGCSSIGRSSSFVASQKLFGSEGSAELQCSQDKGMVHRCIAQLRTTAANSLGSHPIPVTHR